MAGSITNVLIRIIARSLQWRGYCPLTQVFPLMHGMEHGIKM
jgi:hypothetical protein